MGYLVKPSVKLIMGEIAESELVFKMSSVKSSSHKITNNNHQKTIRLMTLRQKQ